MSPPPGNSGFSPFKVTIASLDSGPEVTAQYNPKEVQVDKSVAWNKKDDKNTISDTPVLEFSGGQGRSMSLELLFDGFEQEEDVHKKYIADLLTLATIIDPKGNAKTKRPHLVQVIWGDKGLPEFKGVIESVSTKYTMFAKKGFPVRATCTVKLKEASEASFKAPTTRAT